MSETDKLVDGINIAIATEVENRMRRFFQLHGSEREAMLAQKVEDFAKRIRELEGGGAWAKICCEEGVIYEKRYETKAEVTAFIQGAVAMREAVDPEDDFYFADFGPEEAKDE